MISRFSTIALIIGSIVGTNARGEDAVATEAKGLEGTWNVSSATKDGMDVEKARYGKVVFSENKLTMKLGLQQVTFPYKLDLSKKPKSIDLMLGSLTKFRAVYELEGETLTFCITLLDRHPTEISDKGQTMFILKRKK